MPFAAIFALPKGLGEWGRLILLALVLVPSCLLLGQCQGKSTQRRIDDAARAEANVEAMKTDAKATEAAAAERVNDATTVAANEKELVDAIEATPDEAPDTVRVRLGCERLRQQGTDTAAIPACR